MKLWNDFRRACIKHNRLVKRGKRKYIVEPWHLLLLIISVPISSCLSVGLFNLLWYWKFHQFLFNWNVFFESFLALAFNYTIYAIYIWRR